MRKIKNLLEKIRKKYQGIKQRFCDFTRRNWGETGGLLYWVSLLLCSLCIGLMSGSFMRPMWAGVLFVWLIAFVLLAFLFWILKKIVKISLRNGSGELLAWLLLCMTCAEVLTGDLYEEEETEVIIFIVIVSVVVSLFLKSLWALLRHKRRTRPIIITLILTAVPMAGIVVLLGTGGFSDTYISKYLELAPESTLSEEEKNAFQDAMAYGHYTVESVTYGVTGEEDIASNVTNISAYAKNDGVEGVLKEQYQGYPLEETPMAGIVWYPVEKDNCPVLFIIHGNHNWITDSYLGYEYLGTYLASHGYVVVSVDENACNGLSNENDARAILLLENMRQVEKFNYRQDNPLYEKMDYDNLALAGHSRGGEAVAIAYLFNELEHYPDNGNRGLYYHFSIKSLIAIAPVCGQYQPSDRDVELSDVNYMVIHGANDQDVSSFMGMEQYENISFTGEKDCFKTSLYVAGLNHGQFNSLWGKYDSSEPVNRILNVENFLSQEEQQQIAKIFVKTFLEETIGNGAKCGALLTDCEKYNECLPETLYVQSYDSSDALTLCDFEEDVRLETGSLAGVTIRAKNVDSWREEELEFSSGGSRGNYAAILKWEPEEEEAEVKEEEGKAEEEEAEKKQEERTAEKSELAQIRFSVSELDLNGKEIRFDIMDLEEEFVLENAELLDAEVVLTDEEGKEAVVKMEDYASVYPAFLVRLNKLQYILDIVEYKHQFQTVAIPAEDFEGINLKKIVDITIRFSQESGKVAIDNVKIAQHRK